MMPGRAFGFARTYLHSGVLLPACPRGMNMFADMHLLMFTRARAESFVFKVCLRAHSQQ